MPNFFFLLAPTPLPAVMNPLLKIFCQQLFFLFFSETYVSGDVVYGGNSKPPYGGDGGNGTPNGDPPSNPSSRSYPTRGGKKFITKTNR